MGPMEFDSLSVKVARGLCSSSVWLNTLRKVKDLSSVVGIMRYLEDHPSTDGYVVRIAHIYKSMKSMK